MSFENNDGDKFFKYDKWFKNWERINFQLFQLVRLRVIFKFQYFTDKIKYNSNNNVNEMIKKLKCLTNASFLRRWNGT